MIMSRRWQLPPIDSSVLVSFPAVRWSLMTPHSASRQTADDVLEWFTVFKDAGRQCGRTTVRFTTRTAMKAALVMAMAGGFA
jgi:hypothetical protein